MKKIISSLLLSLTLAFSAQAATTINYRDAVGSISVKDTAYGAKCDGVTNDTTAINAAITAAATAKVKLLIPTGTCIVTGPISIPSNSYIEGLATLKQAATGAAHLLSISGKDNVKISGLTLDGNNGGSHTNGDNVNVANSTNVWLQFLTQRNAADESIEVNGTSSQIHIENNDFDTNGSSIGQIVIKDSASYIYAEGNNIRNSSSFGIAAYDTANHIYLHKNRGLNNTLELIGLTKNTRYGDITENHAEGSGDNGISVSGQLFNILANHAERNYGAGIGIFGSKNTVMGNTCKNNNQRGGTDSAHPFAGVTVFSSFGGEGSNNTISGNILIDDQVTPTQLAGVYISGNLTPLWVTSTAYPAAYYVYYNDNLYQTTTGGTSGGTPPTCTSGTCSDGGVTWNFVLTAQNHLRPTGNIVTNNTISGNVLQTVANGGILDDSNSSNDTRSYLNPKIARNVAGTWHASVTKTASTIAFNNTAKTITDSGNGFVTAGFLPGDTISVSGAVNSNNNQMFRIATVAAGTLTLADSPTLTTESAGNSVTIVTKLLYGDTKTYTQNGTNRAYRSLTGSSGSTGTSLGATAPTCTSSTCSDDNSTMLYLQSSPVYDVITSEDRGPSLRGIARLYSIRDLVSYIDIMNTSDSPVSAIQAPLGSVVFQTGTATIDRQIWYKTGGTFASSASWFAVKKNDSGSTASRLGYNATKFIGLDYYNTDRQALEVYGGTTEGWIDTSGKTLRRTAPGTGAYPYTTAAADQLISVTDTSSPRTINLPASGTDRFAGRNVFIKDESCNAATNNITVSGNGWNIEGSASKVINTNCGSLHVYAGASQWFIAP